MTKIRPFETNDLRHIQNFQPQGWNDIGWFFRFYLEHDFCYPVTAVSGSEMLAVGSAILNGESGWLAHIIVAEKQRGQGLGFLVTKHLIEFLWRQKCKSQLLIATTMGEGLYRKLGFETVSEYVFFEPKQLKTASVDEHIRAFQSADRKGLLKLDRLVSGEERQLMLQEFFSTAMVYEMDRRVQGFYLPDIEEGMIIAENDSAGQALLKYKHRRRSRKSVLPQGNQRGIDFLLANDFKIEKRAPRMFLGKPVDWRPEGVFSRAGGFYG